MIKKIFAVALILSLAMCPKLAFSYAIKNPKLELNMMDFKSESQGLMDTIDNLVKSEEAIDSLPIASGPSPEKSSLYDLQPCGDKVFGLQFLCNPSWEMKFNEDSIVILISKEPEVSMIVAKMPSKYFSLAQIKEADLIDLAQYSMGFKTERVKIASQEAIMVKAFSKLGPSRRMVDYFVIKDKMLYTILFSVTPSERWDEYKFLIKTISSSFEFIDPNVIEWRNL